MHNADSHGVWGVTPQENLPLTLPHYTSPMQRVVGIAITMALALGLTAQLIGTRHPLTPDARPTTADADTAADAGPWSLHPASTPAPAAASRPTRPSGPLTLTRDAMGQFHLTADINGRPVQFLVDTGADMVALTREDAQALGLSPPQADFRPVIRSASGTGMGARITLDRLEVAGADLRAMPALVVEGLGQNLLGQTALRQLGRVELNGDVMTISPN